MDLEYTIILIIGLSLGLHTESKTLHKVFLAKHLLTLHHELNNS